MWRNISVILIIKMMKVAEVNDRDWRKIIELVEEDRDLLALAEKGCRKASKFWN